MSLQKRLISFLVCIWAIGMPAGCSGSSTPSSKETADAELLQAAATWFESTQAAAAWFESEGVEYKIFTSRVCGDRVVFVTGTQNPGTDAYQNIQAFIVEKSGDTFKIVASKDGERGGSGGFIVHVLATDDLTVVFGNVGTRIFDFRNDREIDAAFTKIQIQLADGKNEEQELEKGEGDYLVVLSGKQRVKDVAFISNDLTVKYSEFYSDDLMENAGSKETISEEDR